MTITAERLRELLQYDPATGCFLRLRTGVTSRGSPDNQGYLTIRLDGRTHKAHRLAWLWMTGALPPGPIDHCDLDKANNRWSNLRAATNSQNNANQPTQRNNTSGFKGVTARNGGKRWRAKIQFKGRSIVVGHFRSKIEAATAYNAKAIELFGEYARVNAAENPDLRAETGK